MILRILEKRFHKLKYERIGEIISQFKNGSFINNAILKEIINKIEVYSKNKIEITFNI